MSWSDWKKAEKRHHKLMGIVWAIGWLFTIGFEHLTFWRGVLAIIIWPYYIGVTVAGMIH